MRWGSWGWYALLFAVMVLVTVDVLLDGPLRHLDWIVHEFCDAHVRDGTLVAVHTITKLGQRGILVMIIAPLAVIAAIRRRSLRYPVMSAVIVVLLSLLESGLKASIPGRFPSATPMCCSRTGRPIRPGTRSTRSCWTGSFSNCSSSPCPWRRYLPERRRRDIALVTGCVAAVALTVADEHWLTDVLFSLALGPVLLSGLIAVAPFNRGDEPR